MLPVLHLYKLLILQISWSRKLPVWQKLKSHARLQISGVSNFMVRMLNELEVNSVSIERAKEYTEIASEVRSRV